jgi:hypothetical protein
VDISVGIEASEQFIFSDMCMFCMKTLSLVDLLFLRLFFRGIGKYTVSCEGHLSLLDPVPDSENVKCSTELTC